jgi:hypothetical protein
VYNPKIWSGFYSTIIFENLKNDQKTKEGKKKQKL